MTTSAPLLPSNDALRPEGNSFDILRLLLAVVVIYSHSFLAAMGHESQEPGRVLTGGLYTLGGLSVAGFITLSGFLIAESWHRSKSLFDFFKRRVLRIFPAYVICVLACAAIAISVGNGRFTQADPLRGAAETVVRAFLLSPGIPVEGAFANNPNAGAINISLWTISIEFVLYFILAALALIKWVHPEPTRRSIIPILALFAFSLVFRSLAIPAGQYHAPGLRTLLVFPPSWTALLPFFLAGTVAWMLRNQLPRSAWLFATAVLTPVLTVRLPVLFDFCLPFCVTYALLYIGFSERIRFHLPKSLGDLSYGGYLYAYTLQQLVVSLLPRPWLNPYTVFLVATPLVMIVALISWHGLEKHFLRRKKSASTPHPTSPSTPSAPVIEVFDSSTFNPRTPSSVTLYTPSRAAEREVSKSSSD